MLDHSKLENQLIALERRTTRVGRDLVDHPPNGHDDVANAAAGALVLAAGAAAREVHVFSVGWGTDGRVALRTDAPRPRVWARTPGISGVDGVRYPTWETAHKAAGIVE